MQEERVGEFLGLTAWEIPALPSITRPTAARPFELCSVPQAHPAAQHTGLLTPARLPGEGQRSRGLGIFPGSHASEGWGGLQALVSIPLEPPPFPPTPGCGPTFWLLMPSSSQCYTMPLRWEKAGLRKEGVKENQKHCGAALGFAENWLCGGRHLCPVPAPPAWGQSPVPAAAMGPPAQLNLPGWPAPRCCPFWRLHRRISCPSLHRAFQLPAEVLWLSQPSLQKPSDTYIPLALDSNL